MLLEWISREMTLIESNPEKNILKAFPLSVKRTVVASIVKFFDNQYDEAVRSLVTKNHMEWIMEIIGQSFQLPIEDHEVINQAIHIYQKWLFQKEKRPEPMKTNDQYFIREIFKHFSFLFEVRPNQSQAVLKDHIYLCNRVMDIFLSLGMHDILDEESWHHVLKIVLGITDLTLRGGKGIIELNYGLLKVLFELWLCSLTYDKGMWTHLQKYTVQWVKHMAAIKQWSSICIALTQRVANLLYGPTEGTEVVRIQWKGLNPTNNPNPNVGNSTTELDLPDEYVYFAWNMFLYVLGNPNKILDPEIHLRAFQGLQAVAKQLAYVGYDVPIEKLRQGNVELRIPYAPDGNTILDVLGPWFFEAVNRTLPAYNEGRSAAYSALCKIYCRKGGQPFTQDNLSIFYNALIKGLQEDDNYIISAIMVNACKIFSYELQGSYILIPHFVRTCEKILCSDQKVKMEKGYIDPIRSAAITLLSSLLCTPNVYRGGANGAEPATNTIFTELKYKLENILGTALMMETSPRNIQHLLWCIYTYICEEISFNNTISKAFLNKILDLVKRFGGKPTKEYNTDVFVTIYEVLSSLTPLYRKMEIADPNIAHDIVEQVSLTIPILVANLKTSPVNIPLVVEAFYCMCDWIMYGCERVIPDKALMANVISAIEIGLNVDKLTKREESEIEPIKTAAEFTLCHILSRAGQWPPTSESAQISSSITEKDDARDGHNLDTSGYTRLFMLDNMFLIGIVDHPEENGGPGATIVVRDITGKYAWDSRLLYSDLPQPENSIDAQGIFTGCVSDGLTGGTEELPINEKLMTFSAPPPVRERPSVNAFEAIIDEVDNLEDLHYNDHAEELVDMDISIKHPQQPSKYIAECKFQMGRLLLSHFGFLNIDILNKNGGFDTDPRFVQLQTNSKVLRSIQSLDTAPERDCHKIGVVYVAEGQDQQDEILRNEGGSDRFQQFVESLGWLVPLQTHNGFMGGLHRNGSTGVQAPYFADYKLEVLYHVATMMPSSEKDKQQIHKKRHIGNDHTNVIWTEHSRDYYRNTIVSHFNFINVILYPLLNGLIRVDVCVKDKEKTPLFGPLTDGMVLSEHILGLLVRQTAINGNRIVRKLSTGYVRPITHRKKALLEIADRYKCKLGPADYYANFFINKNDAAKVCEAAGGRNAKKSSDSTLERSNSIAPKDGLKEKKTSSLRLFSKK